MCSRTGAQEIGDQEIGELGGARRDRTADLLHAMQALSQLSYGPFRDQESVIRLFLAPDTRCLTAGHPSSGDIHMWRIWSDATHPDGGTNPGRNGRGYFCLGLPKPFSGQAP